jgi:hypothetical protein
VQINQFSLPTPLPDKPYRPAPKAYDDSGYRSFFLFLSFFCFINSFTDATL